MEATRTGYKLVSINFHSSRLIALPFLFYWCHKCLGSSLIGCEIIFRIRQRKENPSMNAKILNIERICLKSVWTLSKPVQISWMDFPTCRSHSHSILPLVWIRSVENGKAISWSEWKWLKTNLESLLCPDIIQEQFKKCFHVHRHSLYLVSEYTIQSIWDAIMLVKLLIFLA